VGRPKLFTRGNLLAVLAGLPSDRVTLAAVVSGARGLCPGISESTVAGVVSEAVSAGEVEVARVRRTGSTMVCFTSLGAARAGVHLSADSSLWVADDHDDPPPWVKRRILPGPRSDDDDVLMKLTDRDTREPLDRVIAIEDDALSGRATTVHILLGLTTWLTLPTKPYPPHACPMHPGRKPRGREYCLWCDTDSKDRPEPKKPTAIRIPS
jgi:hypothetical protein